MPQRQTFIIETNKNCNLDCAYCFIPNKNQNELSRISDEILKRLVVGTKELGINEVLFIWHGGEPLLLGRNSFANALELQKTYGLATQKFDNAIQSNGTLVDDKWLRFLQENDIGVGVSLDGPAEIHDVNRRSVDGRSSHYKAEMGLNSVKTMNQSGGVCAVVSKASLGRERMILDYFEQLETGEIDFLPCFLPNHHTEENTFSITDQEFGEFLIKAFDIWWEKDNPNLSVRYFSEVIKFMMGGQTTLCKFRADKCRPFLAIDTNGDVYPCDTFVGAGAWKLGSLIEDDLKTIFLGEKRQRFIRAMEVIDPVCSDCQWFQLCRGGCTYHRFLANDDLSARTVFCESRKTIFSHIANVLRLDVPKPRIRPVCTSANLDNAVSDVYVDLGDVCNSDCYFCAADSVKGKPELNTNYRRSLKLAREKNLESLIISGGEATIYPGLVAFISYATSLGFKKVQLQTNARSLGKVEFLEELVSVGVTDFGTSLHGHNSEIHDHITRSPGSFRQTLRAIENISSLLGPNPPISVNCVITSENSHFLKEIFYLLHSLDVSSIQFSYLHAIGRAKNFLASHYWPTKTSLRPFIIDLFEYARKIGKPTTSVAIEAYPYCLLAGYERYGSDLCSKGLYFAQPNGDIVLTNLESERSKGPDCNRCSLDKYCLGPWRQYSLVYGWTEFTPISHLGPEALLQ